MELCHPYRVRTRRITIKDRVAPYPKLYHPFRVCNANDKIMELSLVRAHLSSFLLQYFFSICPVFVQLRLDKYWTTSAHLLANECTNIGRFVISALSVFRKLMRY